MGEVGERTGGSIACDEYHLDVAKGERLMAAAVALLLIGCGQKQAAGSSTAAVDPSSATPQPIAKGVVKSGLYVDAKGVPMCPVTGSPIATGKEVGKATYKGVEYHFCCAGCPEQFKASPASYSVK